MMNSGLHPAPHEMPRGKGARVLARLQGHGEKCRYPMEFCVCGRAGDQTTEAARRQRAHDLDVLGSGKVGFARKATEIKDKDGKGTGRSELLNERRRTKNQVRAELKLSPRQLKKLKRAMRKEQKEIDAREAALREAVTTAGVDQVGVPTGMRKTEAGLLVPAQG